MIACSRRKVCLAILLVSVVAAAPSRATTFIVASIDALVRASDAVVVGRIESIRSVDERRTVRTLIGLAVDEIVKGPITSRLTVVEPGGLVREHGHWVHGVPTFFVGERVVLFLHRNRRHELETTFLSMGKFRVVRSSSDRDFAVRDAAEVQTLQRSGTQLTPATVAARYELGDFLRTLRALVADELPKGSAPTAAPMVLPSSASPFQDHFTFAGPPLVRWFLADEAQPVAYRVSEDGDFALGTAASVEAADAALAAWSQTSCSNLQLVDGGTAPPTPFDKCDGVTQITFNDPFGEIDDPIECSGVLAVGGVCADTSLSDTFNGTAAYRITEGDVIVSNGFESCPFWTPTNLAEILTHEVGHTIGLAHSSNDPNEPDLSLREATMYYAAQFDGRGARLATDDIAAVCTLYPTGRTASVALRRFAIVSDATDLAANDRLVVSGVLTLENGSFDPATDTLIIDLRAAGASVFRLAVLPGQWQANAAGKRFRYRGGNTATTTLTLSARGSGILRFNLLARALDLSAAQADPMVISLALGGADVTQAVSPLRTSARGRVYP